MPQNVGSFFAAQIPLVIHNTGSVALGYVTLSMSDAPANVTSQLSQDTTMWIAWNGSPPANQANHSCEATVTSFENGTACGEVPVPTAMNSTAKGLELIGPNSYTHITSLPAGQTLDITVLLQSNGNPTNHTYNNNDGGQTITPTFRVDAVDQNL